MARYNAYTYPLDVPAIEEQGLHYRENNSPGDAKHLAEEPEAPRRKAKGDLGWRTAPGFEPRPLSRAGTPFKNLKGGR